jgi:hypothetical protein
VNNQEILDNAPDGATHVEILTDYKKIYYYKRTYKDFCNKYMYDVYQQSTWYPSSDISGDFRSLSDIKRIVELEKDKAFLLTQRFMGNTIVSTDQGLSDAIKAHNLEQQAKGIESLKFPTMLRKMWSGGDVQKWILEQAKAKGGAE